ncbi:hypothetical protein ACIQCJ_29855 [Streptomyces sp. NPDC093221]|uniref:hypothetical protein n=1 Tax=Streptomyces sp. NPDC093221 TaxID=3366032 RepID=UPI0038001894
MAAFDRLGDLFGSDAIREHFTEAIETAGLGSPSTERDLRQRAFAEAAKLTYHFLRGDNTARTAEGRRQVDDAVVLARHLVRCGYAMRQARQHNDPVGDDWAELLAFVTKARAAMAEGSASTAWCGAFVYITERCEQLHQPGRPEADRTDAYAAVRYLATELRGCTGFEERWALVVGEPE